GEKPHGGAGGGARRRFGRGRHDRAAGLTYVVDGGGGTARAISSATDQRRRRRAPPAGRELPSPAAEDCTGTPLPVCAGVVGKVRRKSRRVGSLLMASAQSEEHTSE